MKKQNAKMRNLQNKSPLSFFDSGESSAEMLKREDSVSAPSSFIANAHNELNAFYT